MAAPKGNKYAEGNSGGRPPLFSDPVILSNKIDEYFETAQKITLTGLVYHLGFADKSSFYDYQNIEEFSHLIKKARLRVEMKYEEKLSEGNCTGAIFALKNMDWKDKTETDNNTNVTVTNFDSMSTADLKKLEQLLSKANGN